nr:phage prohead protease, HK97 family (proheadase_HK97) [uncultured Mediterranean phage uvMED]
MDKEIKSFDLSIKEDGEEKGSVEAVFSVYNNVDSDGDVVVPGAVKSGFANNQVPMVFAHKWDQPIGKGVIEEKEDSAVFKGSFFMDTEAGKEAYNLVKSMGDLQQWSFGFRVNDSEVGKLQKDDSETQARFLKDLTVYEVSPVLVGANQETYTLAIKTGEDTVYEAKGEVTEEKVALDQDVFDNEEDAKKRGKELGCEGSHAHEVDGKEVFMPCSTHEQYEELVAEKEADIEEAPAEDEKGYGKCDYNDSGKCAKEKEKDLEVSKNESSMTGKRFSEEVKDVLAALDDLISRTKAIGILREKDGRKLSKEATTALRAVQDDLNDAWEELDEVISQVGKVPEVTDEIEAIEEEAPVTEEEATEVVSEEVSEEITEDVEIEEAEVEVEVAEEEEVSEDATEEEVDDSIDEVILQAQVQMTESLIAEQEIDE